jgi:hypothetical protein
MTSVKRMPGCSLACSITALGTWPTGASAARRSVRSARLNCSKSQNTMAVAASSTPGQP